MSSKLTAGDLQIVSRIAVFRGLKAETVEQIIAPATAMMLRPHEWIVRQGDPATAFFIIIDGWVKLYRSASSGDDTVIDIMRTHPMIIIGGILQRNPFFVPPTEFLQELRERRTGWSPST